MKDTGETKSRSKLLAIAVCVAFALEFAGCKGGAGGAATTEPAPGTAGTNSVATNATMSADTNTTTATTTK
jgi:hypothetical protein